MADDAAIKREFMGSFFDDFEAKVAFLPELAETGHRVEALILCLVYIEGLGNNLYSDDNESMRNFVHVIRDHGDEPLLLLHHPGMLLRALPRKPAIAKQTVTAITPLLMAQPTTLLDDAELAALVEPALSAEQLQWLKAEMWRGTLAGIVYMRMRSSAVHQGLVAALYFSETTRRGQAIPPLDFDLLLAVLQRIAAAARDLSMDSGKWFGNDAVLQ